MWTLYEGDCLDVMPEIEAGTVDTILTDPPYGLGMMQREWDREVPGKAYWEEALRITKPGGFLLAFGGTRTFHRLVCAIEEAGWIIRDCIMWVYSSGFAMGIDLSRAIDDYLGVEREVIGQGQRSGKPPQFMWGDEDGQKWDITAATSPEAKLWDGWHSTLKPAWEPITVAMKPLDGGFAENALRHGVGGLYIDGSRLVESVSSIATQISLLGFPETATEIAKGRWPSNLIHDGSPEVLRLLGDAANFYPCLPWSEEDDARFMYSRKAPRSEKDEGVGQNGNVHITVKPLAVMRWLCNLTRTPTGGHVCDPFMGSGTTGVACLQTNRDFTGIDIDRRAVSIARRRITAAEKQRPLAL